MVLSVLLAAILDFLRDSWPGLRTWNSSKQKCYFELESHVCVSAVHPDVMYNHDNWDFICSFGGHFVLQFWKEKTKNRAWHGADLELAYPNRVKTTTWQILLRNALQTLRMPLKMGPDYGETFAGGRQLGAGRTSATVRSIVWEMDCSPPPPWSHNMLTKCKWPTCDTLFIKQAVQTRLMLSKCCSCWPNTEPELGLRAVSVGIRLTYAVNCVSKGVESPAQSNLKQEESPRFPTTLLFPYLFKLLALYQRISLMLWDSILGFF